MHFTLEFSNTDGSTGEIHISHTGYVGSCDGYFDINAQVTLVCPENRKLSADVTGNTYEACWDADDDAKELGRKLWDSILTYGPDYCDAYTRGFFLALTEVRAERETA
jgi:hypothetical protein